MNDSDSSGEGEGTLGGPQAAEAPPDDSQADESRPAATRAEEAHLDDSQAEIPGLAKRALDTFFSPGRLGEALARRPVWAGALILGALLAVLQTALIPVEVWEATFREAALQSGREIPEGAGLSATVMRIFAVAGAGVGWFVLVFIMAGVTTLVFSFVLGDEGRYRQHLSVISHAWLVPGVVGLALVPMRIAESTPQLTLNVGTFFFFLPEGYLLKVLTLLDLAQLWAWLVVAQGVHAIHPKRSFASAAVVLMVLALAIAMIFAPFARV